jgi:hypothetical protein
VGNEVNRLTLAEIQEKKVPSAKRKLTSTRGEKNRFNFQQPQVPGTARTMTYNSSFLNPNNPQRPFSGVPE